MPFQFRIYIRTIYESFFIRAPWTLPRLGMMFFLAILFPPLQLLNALSLLLDDVLKPGYKKVQLKNPVFIIGNARSGTTYMHRLMSMDSERFCAFKAWELIILGVGPKQFFQALGRLDEQRGGKGKRLLNSILGKVMAEADKVHKVRVDTEEEDELVLAHIFGTGFINAVVPVPVLDRFMEFDDLPDKQRAEIMGFYRACVQRHMFCAGGDAKQFLSKNPLFTTKIRTIFEHFKDARIVYMARTPYETIASLHDMIDKIWNVQLKLSPDAQPREALTRFCIYSYRYALEQLDRVPQDRAIIVKYEDLVQDPKGTVEAIYRRFGFELSPAYLESLNKIAAKNKGYRSEHHYSLEQFGLSKQKVFELTKDVFDRFGFDPEGEFGEDHTTAASA